MEKQYNIAVAGTGYVGYSNIVESKSSCYGCRYRARKS